MFKEFNLGNSHSENNNNEGSNDYPDAEML